MGSIQNTIDTEIATQVIDSEASTLPFDDYADTQLLEDYNVDLLKTQVIDSDNETETTQILSDNDEVEQRVSEPNSGSASRSFMSVRIASLRASGLAAARKTRSVLGNNYSGKEVSPKDKDVSGTIGREVDVDLGILNSIGRDGIKHRAASSTARKLFTENAPERNSGSVNADNVINGRSGLPEFVAEDHEFAGLSYLNSQEPNELSQANALNVVDRLFSDDEMELPCVNGGSNMRGKSPPVSNAKGARILAQRVSRRNPVREVAVFEWDDSHEDEGGGYFFSKRKEELVGSSCHARRSYTQPKNLKPLGAKKGQGTVDKLGKGEKSLNFHHKVMGSTHSDSRLVVHKLNEDDNTLHASKSRSGKNLFQKLDQKLNPESSPRHFKATGIRKNSLDMCDVGLDTQNAAETLEVLGCGVTVQITPNDSEGGTRDEIGNRGESKKAPFRKRSSNSSGLLRRSKRIKALDINVSREISQKNSIIQTVKGLASDSATKVNEKSLSARQHLDKRNAANKKKSASGRSVNSVNQVEPVSAVTKTHVKDSDRFCSSLTSNGNLSLGKGQMQEDYKTSTPVARQTRQSLALNPLKSSEFSHNNSCDGTGIVVEIRRNRKRPSNLGVDAPKLSNEEDKSIQHKPLDRGSHEKIARASYEVRDAQRYHGVRTRQSKLNLINGVSNADAPSISILGSESYRQFLDRQELEVSCNDVKSVKKRKGRSSAHCNISSLSPEKNSERRLIRQPVPEQAISVAADNSSLAVMSERVVPKGTPTETLSTRSVKDCSGNHVSPTGGVEANASLDASPAGKANLSGTACVTPTNCTTPIHAASPVCIGNGYHKQSCRKKISRLSLVIEHTRLDSNEISLSNSPASKDLRKRRDLASVRALFSHHLDEDVIRQQKKILVRLGASTACSSSEATHFVTDKFVRTRNMLEAIASGKPVVTHLWLESCGQASCFIDERNYILRDYKKEKDIGFSMQVSLARASQNPLLESKRVFITPNVKPSMELVAILVKAVHGQAVERLGRSVTKDDKVPDDLLVLSCEEDFAICMPLLEKGVMIYGSELLLNGIVIQKLEYERHRLFTDRVRRTRSTIWLRKGDGHQFLPVTKCK